MNPQVPYKPSDDILGQYTNASRSELFEALGAWIETAALHADDKDYWRKRALKAEAAAAAHADANWWAQG